MLIMLKDAIKNWIRQQQENTHKNAASRKKSHPMKACGFHSFTDMTINVL